ncbi:STAS domain-containing protein [Streptomyces sp. NPDC005389]|uniref:STAS domain-containing protein n=1 Tax=Streptomyces sp. NPDC005389 TaxID=3157040 RepID=UPI0033B69940
MNNLTVATQHHADSTVITVAGEIDLATCPLLGEATIVPLTGKTLHLDMSEVSFMDSAGLNLMLKLRRRLLAEGSRLSVTGLQDQPASVLHLTQTYPLLVTDVAAAACTCTGSAPTA